MLGVVVALPWELKTLTRETIAAGSCKAIAPRTLLAVSGVGAARARDAAALLIAHGATALVSWGYAAGLADGLKPGALLLPQRIIGAAGESYAVDGAWHRRAERAVAARLIAHTEPLAEAESVVRTPAEKRALAERAGAAAADMETAAHARAAAERGLAFLAVRAVVDTASTQIPASVLQTLDHDGTIDSASVFLHACRAPADWIRLFRVAVQFRAAQRTLTKAKPLVFGASRF